jgi:hypothetical protein
MRKLLLSMWFAAIVFGAGCAESSSQEQRRALVHQQRSDVAAENAEYGIAGDEQRKAEDAHHKAVKKAIDEGNPIPPQTQTGDPVPPPDNRP